MFDLSGVVGIDLIPRFPDENDGQEETNQAHGVEGSHECLGLLSVALKHDQEQHAHTNDSRR